MNQEDECPICVLINYEDECPICMDIIDNNNNKVITECGHSFHCSCLMKNAVHNGFGCPNCRSIMAEYKCVDEEDDEDDEDNEDEEDEEDDDDEDEEEEEDDEEDEVLTKYLKQFTLDDDNQMPDCEYIIKEMLKKDIKIDDFAKFLLLDSIKILNKGTKYNDYDSRADYVYEIFIDIVDKFINPEKEEVLDRNADSKNNIKKIDYEEM
jgi:hypothetical protein